MAWFSNIFGQKAQKRQRERDLSELQAIQAQQTRQMTAQIRRLEHEARILEQKAEIKRLEKELADLQGGDEEEEDNDQSIDNMLINTLLSKFINLQANNHQGGEISQIQEIPTTSGEISLSDPQIDETIQAIPRKYLKMARIMPDDTLRGFINKQGNFSEETIKRAIAKLRKI